MKSKVDKEARECKKCGKKFTLIKGKDGKYKSFKYIDKGATIPKRKVNILQLCFVCFSERKEVDMTCYYCKKVTYVPLREGFNQDWSIELYDLDHKTTCTWKVANIN